MKSINLILGTLGLFAVGCGGNGNGNMDGGGHPLDDGHIQAGCFSDPDCEEGNKCRTPRCNIVTHKCENIDVVCTPAQTCSVSMCEPTNGQCFDSAGNEGASCTTTQGRPGMCTTGYCQALPTCYDPINSYGYMDCSQ